MVFIEASVMLAVAGLAIRYIPFKRYIERIRTTSGESQPGANIVPPDLSDHQKRQIALITREIARAAENVPWNSVCLPQAIAAKYMLNRRGIPSTLYLGVATGDALEKIRKADSHSESQDAMAAHAWLKTGDRFITGRAGHEQFTVVSCFS